MAGQQLEVEGGVSLSSAIFDTTTLYNQWTVFPEEFDPTAAGLTLAVSSAGDMVQVFAAGKYEKGWVGWAEDYPIIHNGAGWSEGDWNGDGLFDSSDMVTAFADGGYEKGLRTGAAAVPEPMSVLLLMTGLIAVAVRQRRPRW